VPMAVQGGVSVVIPVFNGADTLGAAIRSALGQSDCDRDVVVIDDGSTDGSLTVAQSFGADIRVFNGPNRGVSAARNRGIAESAGEWLVFLDADDVLLEGTLKRRLDTADVTNADVVLCDWQEFSERSGAVELGPIRSIDMEALSRDAELACATNSWATTAALMYRRSLVEKIGGFRSDLPVIQDARFLFDASFQGARFAHCPHVGAQYRTQAGSLSRSNPARFWRDVLTNAKQIEQLWSGKGLSAARRLALAEIYNTAARGLFGCGDPNYFEAVERQKKHSLKMALHPRIAAPLARTVGLARARQVLKLLGR